MLELGMEVGLGFLDDDRGVERAGRKEGVFLGVALGVGVCGPLTCLDCVLAVVPECTVSRPESGFFVRYGLFVGFGVVGGACFVRSQVRDGRQGDGDVQEVDVAQAGNFESACVEAIVGDADQQLQHASEVRIVDDLTADEGVLAADSGRERREMSIDAFLDCFDQTVAGERLQ
ncbi:hypothetical protein BA062_36110 [Prauserella flavalba]|uniref:Uncharacterized protein n=1 Tax=Prauserella flavalba TaxID=1477506 RepID=A0A318LA48_9PSEU|nr:hypothetical protein BA062_36110 [Prauserella flavalba]